MPPLTSWLAVALCVGIGVPVLARAQPHGPMQQSAEPSPPPERAAVPRAEAPREAPPARTRAEAPPARPAQAQGGALRRPPRAERESVRERADNAPAAAGVSRSSAEPAGAGEQERPGAVRRPPSDESRTGRGRDRAVPRAEAPRPRDRVYVVPDYWGYRYYDPFYGYGLGYYYYSPWGWMPSLYGPYGYGGRYAARGWNIGSIKLEVKPQDAEVYVDGYYAGIVDDFDGFWQSLSLDSGAYRVEIRKPGYEPLFFDVRVQPDRTITLRGKLRPLP